MKKCLLLLGLLILTSGAIFGDAPVISSMPSPKIIQDTNTKVIYYLESDLRHVAAISPQGKLLWCCETLGPKLYKGSYVSSISLRDDIVVDVCYIGPGVGHGYINKRTGIFTATGMD